MPGKPLSQVAIVMALTVALMSRTDAQVSRDKAPWTVMIYAGVDSSAEKYIMPHLAALKDASRNGLAAEVVLLIDRVDGASRDKRILGADFHDTRLFRLAEGRWERVAGGEGFPEITLTSTYEANTGDPRTLRKFIRFAKHGYPGKRYVLILFGHGDNRSVCPDISSECIDSGESEDPLFTAEISQGLTVDEAVDVLWADVCSFGGIENAYQFRPRPDAFHARVMLASASISTPAPLARILQECGILKSSPNDRPVETPAAFGKAAIKVIAESLGDRKPPKQRAELESWACYALHRAEAVKQAVDRLAVAIHDGQARKIVEDIRGWGDPSPDGSHLSLNYLYSFDPVRWVSSPHFDLYELGRRMRDDERLSYAIREAAGDVARKVDAMVLDSVGTKEYGDFQPGRHGLYVVFPGGVPDIAGEPAWAFFRWYHPFDQRVFQTAFGNYDWCRDAATPGNSRIENWFELLDSWFDTPDEAGGMNFYRW
jgi:clostripain